MRRFQGAKAVMLALYDCQATEDLLAGVRAPMAGEVREALRDFRVTVVDGGS